MPPLSTAQTDQQNNQTSLMTSNSSIIPYEVITNDDSPSCLTLNLKFKNNGPAAVKGFLNYFDVNISTSCAHRCTRIPKQDLVKHFNQTENSSTGVYPFHIPLSSLPLGDAGASYILYVNEEFNNGLKHKEHASITFSKSGSPAAPKFELADEGAFKKEPAAGNNPTMVGRTDVKFNVSLDQSDGGSAHSYIYLTHHYITEVINNGTTSDILKKDTKCYEITPSDVDKGFKTITYPFPAAKIDSNQSTYIFTENKDGKNSEKSELLKHTNNARVVIAPNSITSATFNLFSGILISISQLFYAGNKKIYYSLLAKESSNTAYSTTNIINMELDPNDLDEHTFQHEVTHIVDTQTTTNGNLTTVTLKSLTANTSYDIVVVAASVEIDPAKAFVFGRNSLEPTLSSPSNAVKGQKLVNLPSPTLNTLGNNFSVAKVDTGNGTALVVTGVTYNETPIRNPLNPGTTTPNYLKSHQCFTLTKISSDKVRTLLAVDLTQFSGEITSSALEKLNSFNVPADEVDKECFYEISVYEALALLPSMLSSFPELKTDLNVKQVGKNYYYLLNLKSPQTIIFKDLVDANSIDPVDRAAVSAGVDTLDHDFLGVCMSHVPLSNDQLVVSKIRFEVSTSPAFTNQLFISNNTSITSPLPGATKVLDINQTADLSEYQRIWIFDDILAPGVTAKSTPQKLCEGAAYYVRITYVAAQSGYGPAAVAGSNSIIVDTVIHENSARLLPGPVSVNAVANVLTKKINGNFLFPTTIPTDFTINSVNVSLYGNDFVVKGEPLKVVNLTRQGVTTLPNSFEFDLSKDEKIQKTSYNILVTFSYRNNTTFKLTNSTPTHTTASFSNVVSINNYEIVSTVPPFPTYTADQISGKNALVLRVTMKEDNASDVVVLLPHVGGSVLRLTQSSSIRTLWVSDVFNALSTTLLSEPVILAVGNSGSGFAIQGN
jgi:hypothetical protein